MRVLKLSPKTEAELLKLRQTHDRGAYRVAARIVADVQRRGDRALEDWTRKLDGTEISGSGLWISKKEMAAAKRRVDRQFLRAVEHAAKNVRKVAEQQLPRNWSLRVESGVDVQQLVRPLESIGCYIPGGRFALLSTLVMTAVPAQVASVPRIVAVCPHPNDALLAAADLLGITEFARIGGAQAIAAMAYGTRRIAAVEKICGPGNRFVTAAKQIVSADCAIDMPAGPTEAVVLADTGDARWIAADLLAQAEHAPDAGSYLVTSSVEFARKVQREVMVQLNELPKTNPAQSSIRKTGAILIARSLEHACEFVNRFAPEHLSLPADGEKLLSKIRSSGTIFLGALSAQPFGDYVSGSNHVLPTGGWARRRGGLSASDFVKCISVQKISAAGLRSLADDVQLLADAEGLSAHAKAVEVRR
ncbi:MAG TPA: histidinol dehydrogenase [Candidatus Acidoferrales bacterium]|jgi:histidinol dehydrogenase|nr:histidinol dehydrogenase [Candidatus Acidoferrales bacterium]